MRPAAVLFALFACGMAVQPGVASCADPARQPAEVGPAIDRGLAFLVKDAREWKRQHNCVSCHHAGLVIWAMNEAKRSRHAVDDPLLADLTKWIANSGDGRTSVPRPASAPRALNTKAVQFALALASDPAPNAASQAETGLLLKTIESDQTGKGSFAAWPETRPPIFGSSDETMTALAALAVAPAADVGNPAAIKVRDKAVEWLSRTQSDGDPQSMALRLILWVRTGRPAAQWQPLADRIKRRQNADGGWSQADGMSSDAWATGQALYAISHAGRTAEQPEVGRGQLFLVQTQRPDGSWPMTSRPLKAGGRGSTSLVPITSAGSAWAVIGLARSAR